MRGSSAFWLTRGLLTLVAALPLLPLLLRCVPRLAALAAPLDAWFAFQCERDPRRTLQVLGAALPVCARCTGIYLGLGLGAWLLRPTLDARRFRIWLILASVLLGLDVLSEAWALRPALAALRVLTGLGLSYPAGVALASMSRAREATRGSISSAQKP